MSDIFKNIFTIALALIFVVSILVAMFGATKIVSQTIRYYLGALMIVCEPYYPTEGRDTLPIPVKGEQPCHQDIRFMKEQLAEGISMLVIASPLALLMWNKLKKVGK